MKNLFVSILLLAFAAVATAQNPYSSATVRAVHDGDSYKVAFTEKPDSVIWIRLYGVDAPEVRYPGVIPFDQPFGRAAADSVRKLIKGKHVLVDFKYRDVFDRPVCEVYLLSTINIQGESVPDTVSLAQHIVQQGWAWHRNEQRNAKGNKLLKNIQAYAKSQKVGLWGLKGRAIRPDTFRERFRPRG
ncbi:MAG: thermonuclease family protein [Lewinellaceae bacterium]|nr:thermonuclease family protein [Lewinellaceae bacterium]